MSGFFSAKRVDEEIFDYRRTNKRLPYFRRGVCVLPDNTDCRMHCRDVSSKGLGIKAQRPLIVNSQVKVKLDVEDKNSLLFEGKVCWCKKTSNEWCAGVVFNRNLPFEIERILGF